MDADTLKVVTERELADRRAAFKIFLDPDGHGAKALEHIDYLGFVDRTTLAWDATGSMDEKYMAWREGRRSLALEIRRHVKALQQRPEDRQERAVMTLSEN